MPPDMRERAVASYTSQFKCLKCENKMRMAGSGGERVGRLRILIICMHRAHLPGATLTVPLHHRMVALEMANQSENLGTSHKKWINAAATMNIQYNTSYTPQQLKTSVSSVLV